MNKKSKEALKSKKEKQINTSRSSFPLMKLFRIERHASDLDVLKNPLHEPYHHNHWLGWIESEEKQLLKRPEEKSPNEMIPAI